MPQAAMASSAPQRAALERGAISDAFGAGMEVAEGPFVGQVPSGPAQAPMPTGHADVSMVRTTHNITVTFQ